MVQSYLVKRVEKEFLKTKDVKKTIVDNYYKNFKIILDLDCPKGFYDKVNYLKLYQDDACFYKYVDKIQAKSIARRLSNDIKISNLIDSFDRFIDFKRAVNSNYLPDHCVIKLNHSSGDVYFYKEGKWYDKHGDKISKREVFAILKARLNLNYYHTDFERCYDKINRKIMVEEFLPSAGGLPEYKIFCNNGKPVMLNVVYGRQNGKEVEEAFTDVNLKKYPVYQDQGIIDQKNIFKPVCYEKMLDFAKKASEQFAMIRVDLLTDGNDFYFCEFTFYDFGGNAIFYPLEWNEKIGSLFDISTFKRVNTNQK